MKAIYTISCCLFAVFSLSSCSQLWSGSFSPNHDNCVANPSACENGQICNTVTEACEDESTSTIDLSTPVDTADMSVPLLTPPTSFIFPGLSATKLDFPRDAKYSIEAQGSAVIYYTLDGSEPNPGMTTTMSGQSPLSLGAVPANSRIRWSADYGSGYALDSGHEFLTQNTNSSPPDLGAIPEYAVFDLNGGSVVTVAPGAALTGTLRFQAWQSTATGYCPGCIIQFVVSVKDVGAVGCLNTVTGYGSYPGQSAAVPFSFSAPMTPGTYPVYSGLTLQFSCDGTVATGTEVGLVIVK